MPMKTAQTKDDIYRGIIAPWYNDVPAFNWIENPVVTKEAAKNALVFILAVSLHDELPTVNENGELAWIQQTGYFENGEELLVEATDWHSVRIPSNAAIVTAHLILEGDDRLASWFEVCEYASGFKETGWPDPSRRNAERVCRRLVNILSRLA